jgi:hypothetical protein
MCYLFLLDFKRIEIFMIYFVSFFSSLFILGRGVIPNKKKNYHFKLNKPSRKWFLKRRDTSFKYLCLPVPVVLLRSAFLHQLSNFKLKCYNIIKNIFASWGLDNHMKHIYDADYDKHEHRILGITHASSPLDLQTNLSLLSIKILNKIQNKI